MNNKTNYYNYYNTVDQNFFHYDGNRDNLENIKPGVNIIPNTKNHKDSYLYSIDEIESIGKEYVDNGYIPFIYDHNLIGFKGCKTAKLIYDNYYDFEKAFEQFVGFIQICADKFTVSYPSILGFRFIYLFPNFIPDTYTKKVSIIKKIIKIVYKYCRNFYMAYLAIPINSSFTSRYCIHFFISNPSYNTTQFNSNNYFSKNIDYKVMRINKDICKYISELAEKIHKNSIDNIVSDYSNLPNKYLRNDTNLSL